MFDPVKLIDLRQIYDILWIDDGCGNGMAR